MCEVIWEEAATATLDVGFMDELGGIEKWFKVLSEAERTASLYTILQQADPAQIKFLALVLRQMYNTAPLRASGNG